MNQLTKRAIAPLCAALLATACAEPRLGKSLVVVLPDEGGQVGAVEFDDGKNKVLLDKPLAAAKVTSGGKVEPVKVTQKDVDEIFQPALASLPTVPRRAASGAEAAVKDARRNGLSVDELISAIRATASTAAKGREDER